MICFLEGQGTWNILMVQSYNNFHWGLWVKEAKAEGLLLKETLRSSEEMHEALRKNIEQVCKQGMSHAFDEHSTSAMQPRVYRVKGNKSKQV